MQASTSAFRVAGAIVLLAVVLRLAAAVQAGGVWRDGLLAATSPFLIRFSAELRGSALFQLTAVLLAAASIWWAERPSGVRTTFSRWLKTLRGTRMTPARAEHVTVAIISHNYGAYLRQAVDSVLAQTVVPHVLLMDDASVDETPRIAAEFARGDDGNIQRYRSEINQGLSRTRDAAARLAATEWIVFLDADDWLSPEFIEAGVRYLARHPAVDVLATDMLVVRPGRRRVRVNTRVPHPWPRLLRSNTINATSFVRRSMILELGGYDPALDFEDWDFWIRCLKAGRSIARLRGVHVFRREHGANKGKICDQSAATAAVRRKHGAA